MAQEIAVDLVQQAGDSSAMFLPLLIFPLMIILILLPLRLFLFTGAASASTRARSNSKLPPSPPALPLIGHAHLVGALPHVSLRRLAKQHGGKDFMLLRLGAVPTLVASSMRAAKEVLRTHDRSFASRPRSVVSDVLLYGPSDVVFQPYGEGWRRAKQLVTTHLLNTNKVQSFRGIREEEAGMLVDTIYSAAATCSVVDLSELLNRCTNDIVCCAIAGRSVRLNGWDKVFRQLIDETFTLLTGFNLENFYPGLAKVAGGLLMSSARRKALRIRYRWSELLDKVIDEHANELARVPANCDSNGGGGGKHPESDFIHVLLTIQEEYGLRRENIKAILFNMFAGGTDTSYLVLEFIMAELMLHQDVMAKLQAEVRKNIPKGQKVVNEDDLTRMTYLKAVIKETLRLHAPTPLLVPHISHEDCEVDGYTIPAGTTLLINAWAICRDPMCWDAAEEFIPERFIQMGEIGGVDFRGRDFQFLPFGSGRRMCPAINYSLASIEIILANLIHLFDWELPKGVDAIDMKEAFRLTVCRKEKLLLAPGLHGITQPLEG